MTCGKRLVGVKQKKEKCHLSLILRIFLQELFKSFKFVSDALKRQDR